MSLFDGGYTIRRFALSPRRLALWILTAAVLASLPFVVYPVFLMKAMCFMLFACAFNLMLGFAGLLSFGHAAFFGTASYVVAHALKVWGLTPELAVALSVLAAAFLGLLFGLVAIRRQGIYFAMITLALSQMIFFFALQAPFTGGEDGIQGVTRQPLFGVIDISNNLTLYFVVLVVFLFGLFVVYRTVHSPFGQILKAIRESEPRAISLGYRVDHYKLTAFVISAALSGLAGGTKALIVQVASLTDIGWQMSGEVILMTLLGGMGTVFGPAVGAVVVVTLQNYLNAFGSLVSIVIGVIFVICVLLFRRGIVGEIQARIGR
ncbi:branched-chain amino acid ABC transporter permease [Pelagibius marinus]|uniref:branched-chain amino acid ABC transporter permease n=1 Tax=Pelagibius marinus TaxID=2762760 RepID=UPI0018722B1F|nr:branched-chain amino acid ABC transporter permease [Pelagibius marinus]